MTKRRLRPDELELWQQVAKSTSRLHNTPTQHTEPESRKPARKPAKTQPTYPIENMKIGQRATPAKQGWTSPKTTTEKIQSEALNMDSKAFGRLKRGKLVPEGRLDLHGMTVDQAHPALVRFILSAHSKGLRLVLVITGKGALEDPYDPMPRRRGVLRSQVPQWLRMPPVSHCVLQVAQAHQKHGGGGAYYVYLRRVR